MGDNELLHKISSNPDEAFRTILKDYHQKVYWQVRKMVIDHEDADDVTQEVFIKAWKNLAKFRGDSKFSTWLYRIVFNESYSFLEKRKRRATEDIADMNIEAGGQAPESMEVSLRLIYALKELPPKQRLVFSLKYFDEMKYGEISELVGSSVGNLKAAYHHAVTKIKSFITEIKPLDY